MIAKIIILLLQFAGFSSDSLADRIDDCKAKVLVTCDVAWRGEKPLEIKSICDEAMEKAAKLGHSVSKCVVVSHLNRVTPGSEQFVATIKPTPWNDDRDVWWHEEMEEAEAACYPEWMQAEDPLFMLYTSGSTGNIANNNNNKNIQRNKCDMLILLYYIILFLGKPKGVLHTTAGYLLYASTTFKNVFDYKPEDMYWCTADIGWITGHT